MSCLNIFSAQNKSLIVEQLEYSCHSTEQLLQLWQLGSSLFATVLPYMEESVMSSIASTLSGQYILMATNSGTWQLSSLCCQDLALSPHQAGVGGGGGRAGYSVLC